jgi:hypothetical protein
VGTVYSLSGIFLVAVDFPDIRREHSPADGSLLEVRRW